FNAYTQVEYTLKHWLELLEEPVADRMFLHAFKQLSDINVVCDWYVDIGKSHGEFSVGEERSSPIFSRGLWEALRPHVAELLSRRTTDAVYPRPWLCAYALEKIESQEAAR